MERTKDTQLGPPDSHHLQAAVGWLELGNHLEANEELERIAPQLRAHPDVLAVRWQIYSKEERWEACVDIARTISVLDPANSFGWIHWAYALHELKRTREAWEVLLPKAESFMNEWLVPYNLACYATQLGNLDHARELLERAFELGDPTALKLQALDDPDLEPLWNGPEKD